MRVASLSLAFVLVVSNPAESCFAQTPTPAPAPTTLLQQSLTALVGATALSDITLSGTARRIVGSDDETGTATLKAVSNGSARLDLSLASGTRSETANFYASPAGSWSGPDGVSHSIAFHNLLTEAAWFSPGLAISRRLSPTGFVAAYVAHETLNGQAVEHVSVSQTFPFSDPPGGPSFAHLSTVDFYLASTTLLPAAISFNVHPDNNALLDLPVQILFSDYRSVSGVQVPFHIQKFLNYSLVLDLQFSSAAINSGLTATSFSL